MKTITNIKRRVKNSITQRTQRNHKTHKNKHTKTQLKQYKTHRGGSVISAIHEAQFKQTTIYITPQNINAFIKAYTNSKARPNNVTCNHIQFNDINDINDNTLINNSINIITTQFNVLQILVIVNCNITVLPDSIGNLTQLKTLSLYNCTFLTVLPKEIGNLTELTKFHLENCVALTVLPDSIGNLTQLIFLSLSGCVSLINLPDSIGKLTNLTVLVLHGCKALTILPDTIALLTQLYTLYINGCDNLLQLPTNLWLLTNLKYLYMNSKNNIITNREILYLLPNVEITAADATTYLYTIMDKTNPNSMYKKPIKDFLFPFTKYNVEHFATPEQKELFSTLALGQQKKTPGIDYAEDLYQAFQSTYINTIPYGLNTELSIQDQIDIFTKLRTMNETIQPW